MKKLSQRSLIIVGAAALVIMIGGTGLARKTSTDSFCISCHAYEKVSWDHGDHPDVGCISCHTKGTVTDKTKGVRKTFLTLSGKVNPHNDNLPSYKEALTDNCVKCHMSREILAARPIFKERHEEYRKYAAGCVECHEPGHISKLRNQRNVASRRVI
jgi:cytochrome c nitrite reductase small subunit